MNQDIYWRTICSEIKEKTVEMTYAKQQGILEVKQATTFECNICFVYEEFIMAQKYDFLEC